MGRETTAKVHAQIVRFRYSAKIPNTRTINSHKRRPALMIDFVELRWQDLLSSNTLPS
jgi:hypothetical protein